MKTLHYKVMTIVVDVLFKLAIYFLALVILIKLIGTIWLLSQ